MILPRHNKLLVRREKPPETSAKGLFIPGGLQPGRNVLVRGAIEAIGPVLQTKDGWTTEGLEVGQRVLFNGFSGDEIPDEDGLLLLDISQILAVVSDG